MEEDYEADHEEEDEEGTFGFVISAAEHQTNCKSLFQMPFRALSLRATRHTGYIKAKEYLTMLGEGTVPAVMMKPDSPAD